MAVYKKVDKSLGEMLIPEAVLAQDDNLSDPQLPPVKKFKFSQKLSLSAKFTVKSDPDDKVVFSIQQPNVMSIGIKLDLMDSNARKVLVAIRQQIFNLRPTFSFERNGTSIGIYVINKLTNPILRYRICSIY